MLNAIRNLGRRTISTTELRDMNHEDGKTIFVDVREQSEWDEGHIAWFRHIPLSQVKEHLNEFLAFEKVVFICKSGGRSGQACDMCRDAGIPTAYNVVGGMDAWTSG